jgi:hypothetical protein
MNVEIYVVERMHARARRVKPLRDMLDGEFGRRSRDKPNTRPHQGFIRSGASRRKPTAERLPQSLAIASRETSGILYDALRRLLNGSSDLIAVLLFRW